jgi:hypothetical protein
MKKLIALKSIFRLLILLLTFNNYSYSQTNNDLVRIHSFSSSAALNGVSSPFEGSFAYRSDIDKMFYFNGVAWVEFGTGSSNSWNLSGNTGTNSNTNFLGTSDDNDLSIQTNNTERLIIKTGPAASARVLFPKIVFHPSSSLYNSAVLGINGTQGRLRITSGNDDTFDNSQGASIDLHGNSTQSGYQGRLDLVAGSGAATTEQGINIYTGNLLRATFLGNGNFGINTTNPTSRFHINAGGFRYVDGNEANGKVLTSDANGNASWQNSTGSGGSGWSLTGNSGTNGSSNYIGTSDAAPLIFRTNGTNRMELDALNSHLLFRGNTPSDLTAFIGMADVHQARLRLSGSSVSFNPEISDDGGSIDLFGTDFGHPNSSDIHLIAGTNDNGSIEFFTGGQNRMRIGENGQIGINTAFANLHFVVNGSAGKPGGGSWQNISDIRLKKNIKPYNKGLEEILKINTVKYQYNEKSKSFDLNKTYVGVIAQEIEEILPSTITSVNDSLNTGLSDKKIFDSSELLFTLINAVQELNDKNVELENKLNQLEKLSQHK